MNLGYILFGSKGRISRSQYWVGLLVLLAAAFVFLKGLLLFSFDKVEVAIAIGAAEILLVVSAMATALKRLHDRDKGVS